VPGSDRTVNRVLGLRTPATMARMDSAYWPIAQLRLQTPRLVLKLPSETELLALAALAEAGVHDPQLQPFAVPWTDASPLERARSTLQYQWRQWAEWQPSKWAIELIVLVDGVVAGVQSMSARDFATLREVSTGSWLGQAFQGQGIGTEMRAAILHLAFAGLGAQSATSGAFTDNPASLAVSRKLGYADDGIELEVSRGGRAVTRRLRLDRATWEATQTVPVTITGLERCLEMFGVPIDQPDGS
jgi:RimJ/RimL family protein N-acetyltransferase